LRGASGFEAAIALSACAMNGEGSAQRSGLPQTLRLSADIATILFARRMCFVESGAQPASTNAKAQTHHPSFARTLFRITRASYGGVVRLKAPYGAGRCKKSGQGTPGHGWRL